MRKALCVGVAAKKEAPAVKTGAKLKKWASVCQDHLIREGAAVLANLLPAPLSEATVAADMHALWVRTVMHDGVLREEIEGKACPPPR